MTVVLPPITLLGRRAGNHQHERRPQIGQQRSLVRKPRTIDC